MLQAVLDEVHAVEPGTTGLVESALSVYFSQRLGDVERIHLVAEELLAAVHGPAALEPWFGPWTLIQSQDLTMAIDAAIKDMIVHLRRAAVDSVVMATYPTLAVDRRPSVRDALTGAARAAAEGATLLRVRLLWGMRTMPPQPETLKKFREVQFDPA